MRFFLFPILFISCTRIYLGSFEKSYFDEINQPNTLGPKVSLWEDGLRTNKIKNEFEWWYFDAELEDGSLVIAYFYKVHFLMDNYFIGFNYTSPKDEDYFKIKYFNKNDVSFATDSCAVKMKGNIFKGNLKQYKIIINPDDFDGYGINMTLKSLIDPYRPQDGIIRAKNNFFAWLAAVPNGDINGTLILKGRKKSIKGSGYHDHNWGNTPLQKLFKSWTWFRGTAGPYTVIVAELNAVQERGGFDIPIMFIADKNGILVNKFGNRELFTMKSDLIKNYYHRNNEPQFSKFSIVSDNNVSIKISGENIINNIEIFKQIKVPMPFIWAFQKAKIDPLYIRFSSSFTLQLSDTTYYEGTGVMEIMDLH